MNLFLLLIFLVGGGTAGFLLQKRVRAVHFVRSATRYALWALLFFMGTKLALHRTLFAKDPAVFFWAIGSSVLLTVLYGLGFALFAFFRGRRLLPEAADPEVAAPEGHGSELAAVLLNSGWILAGFLVFLAMPPRAALAIPADAMAEYLLWLLLALIGFDLGVEIHRLDLRKLSPPLLLVPFLNILFTLGCGLLFSLLKGMSAREGLLIFSGLGWYSLSSVLIAQKGLALLSILAFIHNIFRELLSILTAPLAARISPYLPIYLGGATSMDVMLPFVQKYAGRRHTLVSFYSGVVCSLAVIPLVRFLIRGI